MIYPKHLQLTESEEKYIAQTIGSTPMTLQKVLEEISWQEENGTSDLTIHEQSVIENFVEDLKDAITSEFSGCGSVNIFSEINENDLIVLKKKLENRATYKPKLVHKDVQYSNYREDHYLLDLHINGITIHDVCVTHDMDNKAPFVTINHTVYYLDQMIHLDYEK